MRAIRDRATRTPDILLPKQARYQLRYIPFDFVIIAKKKNYVERQNSIYTLPEIIAHASISSSFAMLSKRTSLNFTKIASPDFTFSFCNFILQ